MGTEAQAAQGAVDLVSILGTAGGSSSVTGLLVYLLTRRNGNGNGSRKRNWERELEQDWE